MPQLFYGGDFGHYFSKVYRYNKPSVKGMPRELSFLSRVAKISDAKMQAALNRGKRTRDGYFVLDGDCYVVGEDALQFLNDKRALRDGSRYTRDWLGALVAFSLLKMIWDRQNHQGIGIMLGHTPRDYHLTGEMRDAVRGSYDILAFNDDGVEIDIHYDVDRVDFYDEPMGAYFLAAYHHKHLRETSTLVIDTGGGTTALTPVWDGQIDYEAATSFNHGVLDLEQEIAEDLRANPKHAGLVKDMTPKAIQHVVHKIIQDGEYKAIGGHVKSRDGADGVINRFFNQIELMATEFGGITAFQQILLTGGGSYILHGRYAKQYKAENIVLPTQLPHIFMANVRGSKLIKAFKDFNK